MNYSKSIALQYINYLMIFILFQSDRAVQLFLETEANNTNYYTDSLR